MKDKVKLILEVPISKVRQNISRDFDILGIKLENIEEVRTLKGLLQSIDKPLMIHACDEILSETIDILDRECIIGIVTENNYKIIVPKAIEGGHTVIIRTPIDINLAKEMNILTGDMGLEKILIDTDIGGLGYGFEYGYSMMEKIKLECQKDKYLNKPLISFAVEDTLKTQEAKNEKSALFLEITSAMAVIAAGADYVVLNSPEALKTIKEIL